MIATNEELALLEKWKRKLCLQEWRIKLLTHLRPEEMMVRNTAGCTEWSEAIKTARIEIINPACYGDRIVPFDFEKTLVHMSSWKISGIVFLTTSVPKKKIGTVWTWFLTTSRQSSLQTTP